MNTSVIRYRVADFLKSHPPFDALPEQLLIELAGQGRVKFHETDEYIFRQGQAKTPWVWIIQQGKVELFDETSGATQLRDVLGDAMKTLAVRARGKDLEVACHIAPSVPEHLLGDPYRLRQVVTNLVGNAVKFTEHGEVVLDVSEEPAAEGEKPAIPFFDVLESNPGSRGVRSGHQAASPTCACRRSSNAQPRTKSRKILSARPRSLAYSSSEIVPA